MPLYRDSLPQLSGDLFITDGGIETTLIFHEGLDLPLFAAFDLLKTREGTEALRKYFRTYADLATTTVGVGAVDSTVTVVVNFVGAARLDIGLALGRGASATAASAIGR